MSTKDLIAYLPVPKKVIQLTYSEAIAMTSSEERNNWTDRELVAFQLYHDRCCVPFDSFHAALERVLGRPVYLHELAGETGRNNIIAEFLGNRTAPSLDDIISLLPAEKVIVLDMHKEDNNAH